jgi:hypothetical protein
MIADEPAHPPPTGRAALARWVREHDDSLLFIGLYVSLAVVLSIAISLFWLVALVAVHFAFEWYKQAQLRPDGPLAIGVRASWEVLLDVGLVLFALVLGVYMEFILGVLGIGAAARAGAQGVARAGSRVAGWQSALRGTLLSLDDAVQLGRSFRARRAGSAPAGESRPVGRWGGWTEPWGWTGHLCFWFAVLCLGLLLAAPLLIGTPPADILATIRAELHPWP